MLGKALLLSLALHGIIVAIAIVYPFAGNPSRHEDPITVYLTAEDRTADVAAVENRKKESSQPKKQIFQEETPRRALPSLPAAPGPLKTAEKEIETPVAKGDHVVSATPFSTQALPATSAGTHSGESHSITDVGTEHGNGEGAIGSAVNIASNTVTSAIGYGNTLGNGPAQASRDYVRAQFTYIRGLIVKNLTYPSRARQMGQEGAVTVGFVILENGLTQDIKIVESSGNDLLDRAVVRTIQRIQPFPKPPAKAELILPIAFKLE